MNFSQAVILAGGRGTRLHPLTDKIPKPMAPINAIPFLDYLINSIVKSEIKNILILLGYKAKIIFDRYKDLDNINIEFSHGEEDEKTGRRVLNAYDKLNENFLLMYGDNYWPIELDSMILNYGKLDVSIVTTVFSNKYGTGEYGFYNNIEVGNDGLVNSYDKERKKNKANGVDIGYFLMSKDCLDPKISANCSFEKYLLPKFIEKKDLGAYITDNQYYYITNYESLKGFESAVKINKFRPLNRRYFRI